MSEEYDMRKLQLTIEKHLIKKITPVKKLYGQSIENHIDLCLNMIYLSHRYRLNLLKKESIDYLSSNFEKKQIINNSNYINCLDESLKIELLNKQIDYLEEKLKQKTSKWKQMEDDLLRQKFEIQRLNNLIYLNESK